MKSVIPAEGHVSLDLWMTLIRSNPVFKPARNQLIRDWFGISMPVEGITVQMQQFDRLFNRINETTGHHTHCHTMLMVILEHLGADIQEITDHQLNEYYDEMEKLFFQYPPLWCEPDIAGTLHNAKALRGLTFSLLSNTGFIQGKTLRRFLENSALEGVLSFHLYSDELLYAKPHPHCFEAVYHGVQAIKDIPKAAVTHIGDNDHADAAGARAFGFNAALVGEGRGTLREVLLG